MQLLIIARDKLALLVLSTNIPRVLAVSQRQHILYQFIDRVLNGARSRSPPRVDRRRAYDLAHHSRHENDVCGLITKLS